MDAPLTRADRLRDCLNREFSPQLLEVEDDSARHAGHAGARDGGETHYTIRMTAAAFTGQNRVARHRAVNQALAGEFEGGLHALALVLRAPDEPAG